MKQDQTTKYGHCTKQIEDMRIDVPYFWCCQCQGCIPTDRVHGQAYHIVYINYFGEVKVALNKRFCPDCGYPLGVNIQSGTVITRMPTTFEPTLGR